VDADLWIQKYEKLREVERDALSSAQFAKATWIYYVKALMDLRKGRIEEGMRKLNAVTTSPDDFLAADAAYTLGLLAMEKGDFDRARETFEYLLFATRSAESAVRATYALGRCYQALGRPEKAAERFAQLEQRYPLSPLVALARKPATGPAGATNAPAPRAGTSDAAGR